MVLEPQERARRARMELALILMGIAAVLLVCWWIGHTIRQSEPPAPVSSPAR